MKKNIHYLALDTQLKMYMSPNTDIYIYTYIYINTLNHV